MKYTKEPFYVNAKEEENIQNKRARFIEDTKTVKAVHMILVRASGIERNQYSDTFQKSINLDELFAEYVEI